MIPGYAPSNPAWQTLGYAPKVDGRGYSLTFFFALTAASFDEWANPASTHPAIQLLRRFVAADLDDDHMHLRMKAITRVINIPQCNVSFVTRGLLNTYNSTPFLTRPQHQFYRGPGYFEISLDVHQFQYLALQGLSGVQSAINSVVFDFSFVVEGALVDVHSLGCLDRINE
jgi:hypothetical protein